MDKYKLELLSRIERVEKRQRKKAPECLCPNCRASAIRSHSQPRGGSLLHIAENGHVMGICRRIAATLYDATPEYPPNPSIIKIGLKEASTFWGYCNKHDTELFKCLETKELQKDDIEQVFAMHLRALSFEYKAQLQLMEILRQLPAEELRQLFGVENEVLVRENLFKADSTYRWNLMWRDDKLAKFQKDFSYEWVVIPEDVGVSTVGMIPPLSPIQENLYMTAYRHADGSYEVARPTFSLSVMPTQSATHVVMCWHIDDTDFVESWRRDLCAGDNTKLAEFLNTCIFTKSEDFYIRPSLWNSLSPSVKELVGENLLPNLGEYEVPNVIVLTDSRQNGQSSIDGNPTKGGRDEVGATGDAG